MHSSEPTPPPNQKKKKKRKKVWEGKAHLITSMVMFKTLKLRGSFFNFSLSVMQIRIIKMAREESGDNIRHSSKVFLFPVCFGSPFSKIF